MSLWREEARLFFTALQFFTRVPVPAWVGWSPAQLNAAARYFPLVGAFVGAVAGGVFEAARLLWPVPTGTPIAVLLSMAAGVLLTGAFHEDGFADSCDGFGGGADRARVLAIMKDSRVGSYAVIGLLLLLALKFELLRALPTGRFVAASIASHALSRAAALCLMAWLPYVQEDALSKSRPIAQGLSRAGLVFGLLTSALAAVWLGWAALAAGAACAVVAALARRYLQARLGGYVGDALGATQQLAEVACLLSLLAWWSAS